MTAVFLSGSRQVSRLNSDIYARLDRIVENKLGVLVGDANGADKAFQKYFAKVQYENVTVFCVGDECRNNIGQWHEQRISPSTKLKGRELYAIKDKAMAEVAAYGLVVWDGKSAGSMGNVLELSRLGKGAVVYFLPSKTFHTIKAPSDIEQLLTHCDEDDLQALNEKLNLTDQLRGGKPEAQLAFEL